MNTTRGNIFARGACPPQGSLVLYHQGKLPVEEQHAIEHHLTSCEACSDILEGLQLIGDPRELESIELELATAVSRVLAERQENRTRIPLYRTLAIAATVALLIGLGVIAYLVLPPLEPPSIAYQEPADTTPEAIISKESTIDKPQGEESIPRPPKTSYPARTPGSRIELALSLEEQKIDQESFDKGESLYTAEFDASPTGQAGMPAAKRMVARQESSYATGPGGKQVITGRVTSTRGEPLPGVSVLVKGSTRGTVTDLEGRFSIPVSDSVATLTFNYIGYATESIHTRINQSLSIAMHEEITQLDEVVVTGYGTRKKIDLTGSVSTPSSAASKQTVEELEVLWRADSTNLETHRELLKQYLEKKEGEKALALLEVVKLDPHYINHLKEIETIMQLVRENKFNRALSRWKDLK